ncbi:transglycosylase SLT domain-containing protein [Actinoplanes sp. LDG1-06]|uniref:Transglycosylase SLT domain-containing protein n=1 Tax=Paractinoplanes ovalisporus TaxID=2810368 RepID=A0ABS2AC81_9ACTN|nr:lytic murein transglycosylase [Actinoplanes ovalisporus]MBM2617432.1 transglycosylase SLT domain-containing protein [Actinoplanes ovalisporus]
MSEVERAARLSAAPGKEDSAADKAQDKARTATDKAEAKAGAVADKTATGADKAGESTDKAGTSTPTVTKGGADGKAGSPASVGVAVRRRSGLGRVGRGVASWAKRPSGRLIVPAVIAVLLLGAAGTAGAYLVPEALQSAPSPSATPGFPLDAAGGVPSAGQPGGLPGSDPAGLPSAFAPSQGPAVAPTTAVQNGVRPADALAGWAGQIGTRVGIPVVAVQAYGYAELVTVRTNPACRLSWTTLAAIAYVESSHGSANGAVLSTDGTAMPPILGLPLDGKGGRQLIPDTDRGALDQDTTYDRAVGPMQFIPATWNSYKVDADNNGIADPNDIDDAALTAAKYLCQNGRDMSKPESWWDAILSYNAVRPYAQKVFDAANDYGKRSRS